MAVNSSAPAADDIWHLSIDDLLSPLPEKPRLGGPGPFVINLTSSTAGITLPTLAPAGCESTHAYEIQRSEDGRTRYRLRLGPFETEEEADLILQMVRETYPGALTATAGPDDLKSIAALRAKATAASGAAVDSRRVPAPPSKPTPALPPVIQTAVVVGEPAFISVDLSLADIVPAKPPEVLAKPPEPPTITARVELAVQPVAAKRLDPPVVTQRVDVAASKSPAAKPKQSASIWDPLPVAPRSTAQNPTPAAAKPAMSVSTPLVRRAAPQAVPVPQPVPQPARVESHPSLDSTQTMRALTAVELKDQNALPWFVIELATANRAFDPDTVPNLDIFAEYRLYSVAEAGTGGVMHALRVGFFGAEIAAKAVASYLAQYYDKPTIKRVSVAERERFAERAVEARKDVGATGRHAVIEITDDLVARRKRQGTPPGGPSP